MLICRKKPIHIFRQFTGVIILHWWVVATFCPQGRFAHAVSLKRFRPLHPRKDLLFMPTPREDWLGISLKGNIPNANGNRSICIMVVYFLSQEQSTKLWLGIWDSPCCNVVLHSWAFHWSPHVPLGVSTHKTCLLYQCPVAILPYHLI